MMDLVNEQTKMVRKAYRAMDEAVESNDLGKLGYAAFIAGKLDAEEKACALGEIERCRAMIERCTTTRS